MPAPAFDQALADQLFPVERPRPPDTVFELGLVLGGTVAAGAYTAGALDFLLSALELWHSGTQPHSVRIPIVTGASGGAICAAVLGLISRKNVPHIEPGSPLIDATADTGNPLWDLWVNKVNATDLLARTDLDGGKLKSLLDADITDAIQAYMVRFAASTGTYKRAYFSTPYRLILSLTNLRGIPYRLDVPGFEGWSGASYLSHDDYARFAIPNGADPGDPDITISKRPDEFWVDPSLTELDVDYVGYETLALYAAASSAFPIGLKARAVSRPPRHYVYRPFVRPRVNGVRVEWPQPDWWEIQGDSPDAYDFPVVDGGTFNNDPVTLAHQSLAGLVGENPRDPDQAYRALFMIDPLADKPRLRPDAAVDLFAVAQTLIGAVTEGARYLTADMVLLAAPDVFSRFQLVPSRPDLGRLGEDALAGSKLYAFGGFCCRAYRVHDFMLGRRNMQSYLRGQLTLRSDNRLFAGWNFDTRRRFAVDTSGQRLAITQGTRQQDYFLPVIPDMTYNGTDPLECGPTAMNLPWPSGCFDPQTLKPAFEQRIEAVLEAARQQELPGFGSWLLGEIIGPQLASGIASQIIDGFATELKAAGL